MSLDPTNAILFGSADSLDRDTLYPVELLPDPHTCKQLCSQASENRNLVVLQDGVVAETYKGLPDETNNALWTTYDLHSQAAPNPVCRSVRRIVPLKVVRATRMILSLLTRTQYRQAIKTALSSFNQYERQQVLASIDFRTLELPSDSWKSIAFQLAQTICLIESDEFYTKSDLQQGLPDLADWIARRPGSLAAINDARDRLLQQVDGVYVRQKGDLNLFMYGNALAIDDWNQFARQCRGMIIDMRRERCVHFPMDKFFRFGEGPELDRQHFSDNLTTEIVEKLDGSMVSLFEHQGRLEFSCKGTNAA